METLQQHPTTEILTAAPPANDDCARVPVMRLQPGYRRVALRTGQSRRTAMAALLALAFCFHWFVIRDALPAEIATVRAELRASSGADAVTRFDAALKMHEDPSLLRLHLLSRRSRD